MPTPKMLSPLLLAGLLAAAGCASTPPPKPEDALSRAEYAIAQATRAVDEPGQSVPLYEAEQKLQRARSLVAAENRSGADVTRARRLAEEAVLDANLAEAQAARGAAERRIAELEESLATLREEIDRATGGGR